MKQEKEDAASIDEYIHSFPEQVQKKLTQIRETIREQAPHAQEKMSYQIPTFFLNGNLVHFAAYAKHIGFYPGASGVRAFEGRLAKYKHAKGSVQFPIAEPLPIQLIRQIVKFRVIENTKRKKK